LQLFYRAIELDPEFASAYGVAAGCYSFRKGNRWMADRAQEIAETERLARRAVQLGKDDAIALATAGFALAHVASQLDDGADLIGQGLELNPNHARAWGFSGWVNIWLGAPETAIEHLARALRLSPVDPYIFGMQGATAFAHFFAGRYGEAASWAQKAILHQPNYFPANTALAASHALAGRLEEANNSIQRVLQLSPSFRISDLADELPHRRPEDFARFADGLRRAGLPE
jgi:tetratricopeptide (TPR) repeat protein